MGVGRGVGVDSRGESSGDVQWLGRAAWLWTPVLWWECQNFPPWVVAKIKELLSGALGVESTQSMLAGETTLGTGAHERGPAQGRW